MGVGSAGIQIGDCVVAIRGVNVPMVVRRVGGDRKKGGGKEEEEKWEGDEEDEEEWKDEEGEEEETYRLIGPAQILGIDLTAGAWRGGMRGWENEGELVEIVLV